MGYWRVFFCAAGLYNLTGGLFGFFSLDAHFSGMGLSPPTYPFAFHLLFLSVAILGLAYLVVARDPPRHRDLIWLGLATKLAGLTMSYQAIATGQLPPSTWWQPLINDLVWAVGFGVFLLRTEPSPRREGERSCRPQDA